MSNIEKMVTWVQSYMDMAHSGTVTMTPDYIPGNCLLEDLGSRPVNREQDVVGNLYLRRRHSFSIRYFATAVNDAWLENLENWMIAQGLSHNVQVWLEDKAIQPRPEGLWVHSGKICLEYDSVFPKEAMG